MADMNKINVNDLENVAGGEKRQVNTKTTQNGVLQALKELHPIRTAHG